MNKKMILLALICWGLSEAGQAAVSVAQDTVITTTDRSCAVHYLNHVNTTGWYLTDVDGSCADGFLTGDGVVVIRNAFGKEVEQLTGFFTQGYWTGGELVPVDPMAVYLSDGERQTVTFSLGQEERLDIKYIGKMSATKRSDGTYGPFQACEPAQVLALTPDVDLFEDEGIQQELINSVINRVSVFCELPGQIYFYGSSESNPENQDIAFFADINLQTRQIKVRRLPSSNRARDILQNPGEGESIPRPHEVRRERALPIMEVKPVKTQNEKIPLSPEPIEKTEVISPVSADTDPVVLVNEALSEPTPAVKETLPISETASDEIVKETEIVQEPVVKGVFDAIPNLLTASRLLKQPVLGKAVVYVAGFGEDGTALVDEPVALRMKGAHLSLGWGIVEGQFSYAEPTGGLPERRGFVQVVSFTPYQEQEP